jgi:hypothetical protein
VEHQDLPVALVKAVLLELRELEDLPEQVELQAKAVHLDLVDHLVNQELLGRQGVLDHQDNREQRDLPVPLVPLQVQQRMLLKQGIQCRAS